MYKYNIIKVITTYNNNKSQQTSSDYYLFPSFNSRNMLINSVKRKVRKTIAIVTNVVFKNFSRKSLLIVKQIKQTRSV